MTRRILVVDDESHILHVLSLKLRNSGFCVDTAVDGEDALHQIAASAPDLIITDLQMPYLNGVELCQRLTEDPSTADIPVIILAACSDEDAFARVKKVTPFDYNNKPVADRDQQISIEMPLRIADSRQWLWPPG